MSIENQKRLIIVLSLIAFILIGMLAFTTIRDHYDSKERELKIYEATEEMFMADFIEKEKEVTEDWLKTLELNHENLELAMEFYEIEHADIVMSQALIETGHFKSYNCTKRHNLFGLVNSRQKRTEANRNRYFVFNHWSESVKGYKDYVQYKFTDNKDKWDNDYYVFLQRLGYAEDPTYVSKVRNLTNKRNKEDILLARV